MQKTHSLRFEAVPCVLSIRLSSQAEEAAPETRGQKRWKNTYIVRKVRAPINAWAKSVRFLSQHIFLKSDGLFGYKTIYV
jgi:hypothetical protein